MRASSANDYPATWYVASGHDCPRRPSLADSTHADVCIVGGGLAGLSVAWRLAVAGVSVVLLESKRIAWGASGRNGGFVSPGFAGSIEAVAARSGRDTAKRLYQYSVDGADTVRSNVASFAPDCLMGEGKFSVSRYPAAGEMRQEAEMLTNEYNDPVTYLDANTLKTHIRSDRYFEGIYKPRGFQIHPLNYALAMAVQIEAAGGRLFETTAARAIDQQTAGWEVKTEAGRVQCNHIVLCTSGYDSGLYRPLSRAVLPVSTHVVVTGSLRADQLALLNTRCGIADTGNACDYYRLIEEDRLLWGGKITTSTSPPRQLDSLMRDAITEVFPTFSDLAVDYAWSGLMGYCRHKMPLIRQPQTGLWIATAFGGHGLNTTAMAGNLLGDAIVRNDESWRDFSEYDLRWNGGPLGQAAVQSSYWWMQAKDRYLERRAQ